MAVIIKRPLRGAFITVVAATIGYAAPVDALELGTLTVHSYLNQPFDATVVVTHLSASKRDGLDVGMASPDMFKRFGMRRSGAVDRMRIRTRFDKKNNRVYVHLSTRHPIKEPFVDFLLRASAGGGSALREYTAMLDPGGVAAAASARPRRSGSPAVSAEPVSNQSGDLAGHGPADSHRVRSGETLWSIAAANKPGGASLAQTILAVYHANPSAFDGRITALLAGATLRIPNAASIRSVDAAKAKQQLEAVQSPQDSESRAPSARASSAPDVVASGQAPPARRKKKTQTEDQAKTEGKADTDADDKASAKPVVDVIDTAEKRADPSPDHATDAAPSHKRFGRLSLPSDTPWPTPAPSPAAADSPKTKPAAATSSVGNAHAASTIDVAATKADAGRTVAAKSPAAAENAVHSPIDVAAGDESWLRPRNILILGLVVLLLILAIRRRLQRGIEWIGLETEVDEPRRDSEPAAPVATTAVSCPTEASAHPPAPDAAALDRSRPDELRVEPPHDGTAAIDAAENTETTPSHECNPAQNERVTSFAGLDPESVKNTAVSEPMPSPPTESGNAEGHKLSMADPVIADAAAGSVFNGADGRAPDGFPRPAETRSPKTAAGDEIQALTFESEPPPQAAERRHDRGDEHNGLTFETDEPVAGRRADGPISSTAQTPKSENTASDNTGGLKMIDPGEFDLYDLAADTAEQTNDSPDDSVATRLDLARMYVDMGDHGAARDLLADVDARGDENQRCAAHELLDQI